MNNELIELALAEDLSQLGDVTSQAIFSDEEDTFYLYAKDRGVLCGTNIGKEVFTQVDPSVSVQFNFSDGESISYGDCIAVIHGKVLSILTAERTAINFLSNLSGIATKAKLYVNQVVKSGTKDGHTSLHRQTVILDTRKTIPGYRELAKYAVTCGGAQNHRQGLYDLVMIKDNHIDAAGSITTAVTKVRRKWGNRFAIEVETRTLKEIHEALACKVDRIMLDNMSTAMMEAAVHIVAGKAAVEASGNMTLDRIAEVSRIGVDFISVGDLTHSVKAFDFSLKQTPIQEG